MALPRPSIGVGSASLTTLAATASGLMQAQAQAGSIMYTQLQAMNNAYNQAMAGSIHPVQYKNPMENLKEEAAKNIYAFTEKWLGASNALRISGDVASQFIGPIRELVRENRTAASVLINPRWDQLAGKTWIDIQIFVPGHQSVYIQTYADGGCEINKTVANMEIKTRLDLMARGFVMNIVAEPTQQEAQTDVIEKIYG